MMKAIIMKVILVIVGLLSVFYIMGEPIEDVLTAEIFWCKVLSFIVLLGCIVLWRIVFNGDSSDNELA